MFLKQYITQTAVFIIEAIVEQISVVVNFSKRRVMTGVIDSTYRAIISLRASSVLRAMLEHLGLEIDLNKKNHRVSHLEMVREIFPEHVISLRGVIG